jgi:hypothetical protein
MAHVQRLKLVTIDDRIRQLYLAAQDDILELMALEDALWNDTETYRKQFKMGKVRVYDTWGILIGERIQELKRLQFQSNPLVGIF